MEKCQNHYIIYQRLTSKGIEPLAYDCFVIAQALEN